MCGRGNTPGRSRTCHHRDLEETFFYLNSIREALLGELFEKYLFQIKLPMYTLVSKLVGVWVVSFLLFPFYKFGQLLRISFFRGRLLVFVRSLFRIRNSGPQITDE